MAVWGRNTVLLVFPLWINFGSVAALSEPEICYVLDGILFLYGIILTALYCRLKILNGKANTTKKEKAQTVEEGVYSGLTPRPQDTYETIGQKK